MTPITKAQRAALKRIFDRGPIFKDGYAPQIAMNAGWTFVEVANLPEDRRAKVTNPAMTHVWIHDRLYSVMYAEAADIVRDYRLSSQLSYRQFRKTVAYGYDCLMVAWAGMWLGIEKDGYTHS